MLTLLSPDLCEIARTRRIRFVAFDSSDVLIHDVAEISQHLLG